MVYFPVLFLCITGLFLALLRDRYRLFATVGVMAGAYLLATITASLLRGTLHDSETSLHVPVIVGIVLLLGASLFIHENNWLQKVFLAVLSLSAFSFLLLFTPLFLGVLPFSVSGAPGGVLSLLSCLLIYLLLGLCLYRPMQRFSQRGPSVFLCGMTLLSVFQYLLCTGRLDGVLGISGPIRRLFLATAIYCVLIFCFRSIYQAGRWQNASTRQDAWERMLEMESRDYLDMLASVREVRAAQRSGEYALDTVAQLLRDGQEDQIPDYIANYKSTSAANPILTRYHENPYLNAVIATKAAFASQNQIEFQSNAAAIDAPVKTAELCVLADELLTRAAKDAAAFKGPRRLRFTAIPGEDSLRLEVVYSGELPRREKFSPRGKQLSDFWAWLFGDPAPEETELRGLQNSAEIVLAHSGSLTVAEAEDGVIIRALLRF